MIQPVALGCTKLSICCFYRRIFRGKIFNVVSKITIALVILWIITFIFALPFGCHTHASAWWESLANLNTYCVNPFDVLLSFSVVDVAVDLMILITPIPLVSP